MKFTALTAVLMVVLMGCPMRKPTNSNPVSQSEDLPKIDSLWNYRDAAATESAFLALMVRAKESGNAAYVAELYTQIARTQGLQQRFDEAFETLDQVEASLTPEMHRARVRSQLERGRALNSSGQKTASIPVFEAALSDATAQSLDGYAVDAAHMLGIVCEPEAALVWNERALKMAEASEEPRAKGWRGPLLNNLGWTYHTLGRYEDALGLFERHYALLSESGKSYHAAIARWAMGKQLRFLGRVEEALELQMALLDHPERQNNAGEGYTREEVAECLLLLERSEEAAPYFARAWELLHTDKWLIRDEAPRLERMKRLGRVE